MKRMRLLHYTLPAMLLLACVMPAKSQPRIPKNAKEDTQGVMSEGYWKLWNDAEQARIDADIEAYRKADAVLKLDLKSGTTVKVEQLTHDFIFGANIFNFNQLGTHERNERYKALFGNLFNSATIAFYWKTFETEPGRLRFNTEYWDTEEYWNNCPNPKEQPHWRRPSTDQIVEFCEQKGIRAHGHTIIWGNRNGQHPSWIIQKKLTPEERQAISKYVTIGFDKTVLQTNEVFSEAYKQATAADIERDLPVYCTQIDTLFAERIKGLALRYGGRLQSWDVVNESSFDHERRHQGSHLIKGVNGIMPADYTSKAFHTAQSVFPADVKLNINDFNLEQSYLNQVNDLRAEGCKIDVIGSQMHLFNPQQCVDIAEGKPIQTPEYVRSWIDRLGQAGLPIHLSEITITSPGSDERGQMIQAIITRNLYRLWFSAKPMMGITWWNVVEECGALNETSISGLFTRDMEPKTSFYALDELINHEWKTNLTLKADRKGEVRFRGFKGKYKVTWQDEDGRTISRTFDLSSDGDGI